MNIEYPTPYPYLNSLSYKIWIKYISLPRIFFCVTLGLGTCPNHSLTNKIKSHLYVVVSKFCFTNLLFSYFNNWIICCVFLPSNWSLVMVKKKRMSAKKIINKLSLWKILERFYNFSSCFIGHFPWGFDLDERRSKTSFCRYREILYCKREINLRFPHFFFKPLHRARGAEKDFANKLKCFHLTKRVRWRAQTNAHHTLTDVKDQKKSKSFSTLQV